MSTESPAYGLWVLVIINLAVFVIFAFSFTRPRTARDWRSFGAFSGFLVALFTEMYGFPLTCRAGWGACIQDWIFSPITPGTCGERCLAGRGILI